MKYHLFFVFNFFFMIPLFSREIWEQKLAQQGVSGTTIEKTPIKKTETNDNTKQTKSIPDKNSPTSQQNISSSPLWENFLEIGITQVAKSKEKKPEDLGSVINSIRIANQFLSNQVTFSLQQSEIVEKKPKRFISYSFSPSKSNFFVNFTYKFYDNQIEYRRYYDTNENFTLDTYATDYRESRIKFGSGPLDYFKDSIEISLYFFKIESKGTYEVQSRKISSEHIGFAGNSTLSYFLYNYLQPSTQPLSYIYGLNNIVTSGYGFFTGFNTKFWKIFSIYYIFDFNFFNIKADLSNISPSYQFYNQITKTYEFVPQIIYVKKNLDINMLLYYELGFSVTVGAVGFKWGLYLTMPVILDSDYQKPKGYIVYLSNPMQIQSLETQVQIFYKGDPSNKTQSAFDIFLGGVTFGAVSKF